jgi:putative iron-regulated protein
LLVHLQQLVEAWDPGVPDNYRAEFLNMDVDAALTNIITGIGELSRGELAGERMAVAYEERSQEDEHSCFSDNTTADILGNSQGIQTVYLGNYEGVPGPGIRDLVAAADPRLEERLSREIAESVELAGRIPAPFDQHLLDTAPNSGPGRASVLNTIEALERQTDTMVEAAQALGITINVS